VFQERFSLEAGTSSFHFGHHDAYVAIGVNDLNGAFFWLPGGGR